MIEQPFTLAGGREGLIQLLDRPFPPTAILCGNDLLAAGALFEAQRRGLRVPGDLSLCGIDDLEIASHVTPTLTTVRLPTAELGAEAARHLLARLANQDVSRRVCLDIELIKRQST